MCCGGGWHRAAATAQEADYLTRDQLIGLGHQIDDAVDVTTRDLSNRAGGLWAEIGSCITSNGASDAVLAERVRSQLGGLASHPSAIEVRAEQGRVILSGPILRDEIDGLLHGVASMRGVRDVENHLQVHDTPGDVPALQGQPKRMLGMGAGRHAIGIQKTINLNAPVDRVFRLWANYQNFPCFMSNVREVKDLGDGRSHWIVAGPAGTSVEWDAVMTSYSPNEVLAWRTEPSSLVQHA
jgi:hypothetical protein